ncbi:hypothetical protein [Homoserinibacter gongjuensis]|uniref:Uncharacterized protein n=1 Tax=Homoserinibacter gongjuensis TaxID=1162968 RepID=A0ABQ6JTQ0_9MICO|nr:hypothetical protein [Homoserinibacter gongjuensis]GMA91538.1 hypothetical protein GCM10025869_20670 [Homoserinibacter gongjuensis]
MATIDRWFEDIEIGERRTTVGRTITEADIVLHAGQTGDFFLITWMPPGWPLSRPVSASRTARSSFPSRSG